MSDEKRTPPDCGCHRCNDHRAFMFKAALREFLIVYLNNHDEQVFAAQCQEARYLLGFLDWFRALWPTSSPTATGDVELTASLVRGMEGCTLRDLAQPQGKPAWPPKSEIDACLANLERLATPEQAAGEDEERKKMEEK